MSVQIRAAEPADATAIATVHVASWQSAYRGILPDALLDTLDVTRRAGHWRSVLDAPDGRTLVRVAVAADGQLVGFASGGPERDGDVEFDGELYTLYLLAAVQRRGIGRALATALLTALRDAGYRQILVWVLADNPARAFYAALGARPVRQQLTRIGGIDYPEIGYGWDSSRIDNA